MSYPATMLTVHLTADFRRLIGGDQLEAQVLISSPSALVSATDDVIVPRANELVETSNGLLDVVLPVADDAEWGPQGFEYLIRATFATGVQMAWLVQLLTAQGPEQDLADYGVEIPYPDSSGPFEILYPSAPVGGGGGGAGVDSFAGRSGAVVPATNDYSVAQINGLATALTAKADAAATTSALASKANTSDVNTALGFKADASAVGTALALKADASALAAKADTSTVNSALALKADTTALAGYVPTSRTITAGTGLTGSGDLSANRTLAVAFGTSGTTAAAGNDNRLSDARTPLAHAASHVAAGSDPLTLAQSQVTGLPAALTGKVDLSTLTTKGDLYVATGAGALVRVGVGANTQVLTADSAAASGVKWAPAGGGSTLVVRQGRNTAGNVSTGTTSLWALVGAGSLTFSIPAVVNDVVSVEFSFMRDFGNAYLDLAIVVSSAAVRYWSNDTSTPATEGCPWFYTSPATYRTVNSPWYVKVASGDLSGGNVTFQFAAKGTSGQIHATSTYPLYWALKNHGAADFA